VLTLALGIGVNTAVFSVVNAVIMRPLRFPHADRLMAILSINPATKEPFESAQGVYVDWRERSTSFETIAGARSTHMLWSGVGHPVSSPSPQRVSIFCRLSESSHYSAVHSRRPKTSLNEPSHQRNPRQKHNDASECKWIRRADTI
jgi:hypothetical protein